MRIGLLALLAFLLGFATCTDEHSALEMTTMKENDDDKSMELINQLAGIIYMIFELPVKKEKSGLSPYLLKFIICNDQRAQYIVEAPQPSLNIDCLSFDKKWTDTKSIVCLGEGLQHIKYIRLNTLNITSFSITMNYEPLLCLASIIIRMRVTVLTITEITPQIKYFCASECYHLHKAIEDIGKLIDDPQTQLTAILDIRLCTTVAFHFFNCLKLYDPFKHLQITFYLAFTDLAGKNSCLGLHTKLQHLVGISIGYRDVNVHFLSEFSTPNSYLSEMLSMIRDKCRCKITIALSVCFKSLVTQHQAYQMKHGQPSSHCNSFQNKPKPKPKDKRIPKRKKACNTTSQPTLDPLKALADLMQYFQFDQAGLVADRHTWDLGDLTSKNVDLLFKALKIMEGVQINYLERITCSFSDKALQPNTDHPNLLIDQMYLLECSEAFVFGLFRVINTTRTQFYIEFPNHKADLSIFLQEVAHLDASRFAIRTSMCSLLINQPVFDRTALDVYIDGMLNLPVLCDSYLLPLDRTLSILEIARLLTWANHEYCRSYDCFIDYAVDVKRHPQLTAFEEDIYSRVPPLPEKNGQADSAFYFLRYVTESQGFYIHYVHRAVNMPLSDELHALAKSNSQGPEIPPVYYPSTLKVTIDSCNESDILYLLGRFMLLIISMRYQPRHLHINGIRLANDRMEIFLEFLYRLDFKERDSLRKPPEHCLSIELTWMDFVTSATTKHILIRPGDSEESEESEESSSSETPPPKPPRGAILPIDCQTATPPIQHLLSIDQ